VILSSKNLELRGKLVAREYGKILDLKEMIW
jgi:hypothetical protein